VVEAVDKIRDTARIHNRLFIVEGCDCAGAFELSKQIDRLTSKFEVRITISRHIQRGGSPSCSDRVLASRLGVETLEALMTGKSCSMVGVIYDELVRTEFGKALNNKVESLKDEVRLAQILSI